MKIAFDIGGVISKYPEKMRELIIALICGGIDVHIITDMPKTASDRLMIENGFHRVIGLDKVHNANWALHQDQCKAELCKELGIDILVDDRPDYCAGLDCIGFVVSPRPKLTYNAATWKDSHQNMKNIT